MIVIGITGEIGSGKDTFSSYFLKLSKGKKVVRMRFSDILKETLELWSLPLTRHNLQYLAIVMDKQFGKGTLTQAVREKIMRQKTDFVLLEGARWLTDVPLIRSFEHNYLVYITSDQEIRFKRVKKRAEKDDEKSLTLSRFKAEDKEPTETQIRKIGKDADVKIENDKTIEEFHRKIKNFYESLK